MLDENDIYDYQEVYYYALMVPDCQPYYFTRSIELAISEYITLLTISFLLVHAAFIISIIGTHKSDKKVKIF